MAFRLLPAVVAALVLWTSAAGAQSIRTPTDFFGFEIGTDGELARYPDVLEYMRHVAGRSDRVRYEQRGTTTNGNPYVLLTISAASNLDKLDRLIAINHRLADPRGLSEADAAALAREGVPFYFPVRHHPLERGGQRAGNHQDNPPAGDGKLPRDPGNPRQHGAAAGPVPESGRPDSDDRPLV